MRGLLSGVDYRSGALDEPKALSQLSATRSANLASQTLWTHEPHHWAAQGSRLEAVARPCKHSAWCGPPAMLAPSGPSAGGTGSWPPGFRHSALRSLHCTRAAVLTLRHHTCWCRHNPDPGVVAQRQGKRGMPAHGCGGSALFCCSAVLCNRYRFQLQNKRASTAWQVANS